MNIHKKFKTALVFMLLATGFSACKKEDNAAEPALEATTKEYKFLRVLVADETSATLTQIEPSTAKTTTFTAKYPLANLYAMASGRYAAVLYGAQNLVEVFDSGLLAHDDHIDVDRTARWASITANGAKPTHFKSKDNESLIFNDGDGTLSVANDADFNTPNTRFRTVYAGLLPHHGAMAQFTNGNYAITSTAATGASPTRVIITDKSGSLVYPSVQEVGAIHGNASDGQNAVFGAFTSPAATAGGVLVVSQNGIQRLIPNPDGFGPFRLATILYAESAKKFIGYTATKGAYFIDLTANRITPVYAGTDAFQCKVDYAGRNLLVLTLDGKLRIYDLFTGSIKKEGTAIAPVASTDTYKPVLEATARFAYVAVPTIGEVHQIDLTDFTKVVKHKVTARPVRLTLFGFESNAEH